MTCHEMLGHIMKCRDMLLKRFILPTNFIVFVSICFKRDSGMPYL